MANDLGAMKTRIASDLERTLTDISAGTRTWGDEITSAINDAIKLSRAKQWWFNQGPTTGAYTSPTTIGNQYVAEYTGLIDLKSLRVTISNQLREMEPVSFDKMESNYDGTSTADTGEPFEYTRFAGRVRIWPQPDLAYTLTWSGTFDLTTLSVDADTNSWMTDGEVYIRDYAKLILVRDYIKSYDDIAACADAVMRAENALNDLHSHRMPKTRIRSGV